MRVVLTVNAAWNLLNFRRPLIAALLADGHEVTVLAPPDDSVAALEAMGCRFIPLPMDQAGLSPPKDAALLLRFVRHFRILKPDVVFGFTIKNNLYGAMAARALGIPFVPNITGFGTAFLSGWALRTAAHTLYRTAFAHLPAVFFQNEDDRAYFISHRLVTEEQVRMVPGSGIDLDDFTPQPMPVNGVGVRFLLIARLLRDKGVVEFVEAARIVRAQYPQARFELLGPLGYENRSAIDTPTVESWIAEGIVEHHGSTNDVRPFIAAADCVVLPSYREGTARTLLEAAAMARPLIATDVPGCRNVVDDGITGFLCRVRDGASLRDALLKFLDLTPPQREAMGRAGRAKMEREFDVGRVIAAYSKTLQEIPSP